MPDIRPSQLETIISDALEDFYKRRLRKITELKLHDVLKRKNPYLYKAIGYSKANDIVEDLLKAFITSSDEGIFGDAFFEAVAKQVSGGHESGVDSVDIEVHLKDSIKVYAVKSGPAAFNYQSKRKQAEAFDECRKRLSKARKFFEAVIGYGYGKKVSKGAKYTELAGQAFWEEITGDPEFYLKLIRLMGDKPKKYLVPFREAYDAALNKFVGEFVKDFCFEDGRIDWDKLVIFNSGQKATKKTGSRP